MSDGTGILRVVSKAPDFKARTTHGVTSEAMNERLGEEVLDRKDWWFSKKSLPQG